MFYLQCIIFHYHNGAYNDGAMFWTIVTTAKLPNSCQENFLLVGLTTSSLITWGKWGGRFSMRSEAKQIITPAALWYSTQRHGNTLPIAGDNPQCLLPCSFQKFRRLDAPFLSILSEHLPIKPRHLPLISTVLTSISDARFCFAIIPFFIFRVQVFSLNRLISATFADQFAFYVVVWEWTGRCEPAFIFTTSAANRSDFLSPAPRGSKAIRVSKWQTAPPPPPPPWPWSSPSAPLPWWS